MQKWLWLSNINVPIIFGLALIPGLTQEIHAIKALPRAHQ
jgi:hypothetical protein